MKFLTVAAALGLGVSTSNACLMDTEIQAERTFKTEYYRQQSDSLQSLLTKAIGDVQAYTDRQRADAAD